MLNPYPGLPKSRHGDAVQGWATHTSVKTVLTCENGTASSIVGLTKDTTSLEITTLGVGAAMRFVLSSGTASVATDVASANYDHVIPPNTIFKVAVPISTVYQAPSSLVGMNTENGLFPRYSFKTLGAGSVFIAEF